MTIAVDKNAAPDTIYFISPRKFHYVTNPDGRTFRVYDESEATWAKRCAVITGIGE